MFFEYQQHSNASNLAKAGYHKMQHLQVLSQSGGQRGEGGTGTIEASQ